MLQNKLRLIISAKKLPFSILGYATEISNLPAYIFDIVQIYPIYLKLTAEQPLFFTTVRQENNCSKMAEQKLMNEQMKTLTSLAILKVDLDEGFRDYLDYLLSFSIYSLDKHKVDPVTDVKLVELLREDFGLNIPRRGCQLVLKRLSKRGYLKKSNEIFTVKKKLPCIDFETKRNQASSGIERVYHALRQYVNDKYNEEWTEDKITDTLLSFLGRFGVEYLRAYIYNSALPVIPETAPKEQFIVSKFIADLHNNSNPLFDCISVLVKGHMYANALVCPDLESLQKKFNNLVFYLDTPLVLNLLGMQRPEEKDASQELIDLLKNLKGTIAVFDHTVIEIKNILSSAERNIENSNTNSAVLKEIRKTGIKRSDVILLRENLDEKVKEFSIKIHKTPPYKIDFQISEEELKSEIEKELTYRNPEALKFDINSIRGIYVLREGTLPKRLEDAKAVFVTQNSSLAKAAYSLGQNHNSTREVSSTITDYSLANIAWLKAPLGAPELPTKELLASCYAALEPSNELWHKYISQIDTILKSGEISADDHALLRISPIVEDELMNLTLGEEAALTGDSIKTILERVKSSLTVEKDKIIDKEKSKYEMICTERDCVRDQNEQIGSNLYWVSDKISIILTFFVGFIGFVLLLLSIVATTFLSSPFVYNSMILNFIILTLFFLAVIWGFLNWYKGLTLKELLRKLHIKIHLKVFHYLENILIKKNK